MIIFNKRLISENVIRKNGEIMKVNLKLVQKM